METQKKQKQKIKEVVLFIVIVIQILLFMQITVFGNPTDDSKGVIKGMVKEKGNDMPVEYANVILYNKADSSLVAGTITDAEGNYLLEKVPEGDYYMVYDFIGYKEATRANIHVDNKKETMLDPIWIEADTEMLAAVTVQATQSTVSASIDKKVVNVKQNLAAKGGTAADALKNAPSITTDAEDNVLLRGSADYKVLINGKPTTMKAADVLRQTPADIIDKIEIITNPSVKYSAEGTAGIINIILKSELARGFNGMLNITSGTKNKYASNLTFNLNTEKLRLTAGVDWRDFTTKALNDYKRILTNGDTSDVAWLYQDRTHHAEDLNYRFNADYTLSDKTSIAYSLSTGYSSFQATMSHNTHGYTRPASDEEYTASTFDLKVKPKFITNNFSITQKLNDKGSNLNFNAYYSHIDYKYFNYRTTGISDASYDLLTDQPYRLNIDNNNYSNEYRGDLDFTHTFNDKTTLESGLSLNSYKRYIDVDFTEFDYNQNAWIIDPTFTNEFDFFENVYAGYALVKTSVAGFGLNVGMRAEYMERELMQITNEVKYPFDKWHFFPSFSASKEFESKESIQLSYSHRINRPDEYMMNPFPEASDNYFYSNGNPFLIPEISHNVEFAYQKYIKKGMLSAQAYYRQTNDLIGQTVTLLDDNRISLIMDNNSTDRTLGSDLMANYDLLKWWSINANASLYRYEVFGDVEGAAYDRSSFQWSGRLVNSFNFKTNTSLQIMSMYNSKTLRKQGELSDFYMVDVAVNQSFFDKRLSLSLQVKDVLQSRNYKLYTYQDNLALTGYFNNESPIVLFSMSFAFNNFKKMTKDVETEFDM